MPKFKIYSPFAFAINGVVWYTCREFKYLHFSSYKPAVADGEIFHL